MRDYIGLSQYEKILSLFPQMEKQLYCLSKCAKILGVERNSLRYIFDDNDYIIINRTKCINEDNLIYLISMSDVAPFEEFGFWLCDNVICPDTENNYVEIDWVVLKHKLISRLYLKNKI